MKKSLALVALLAAAPVLAQSGPSVERLRAAALKDEVAWNIVEGLTTEIGQRAAGTEAERRARDWAVAKLKALGFSNVHVEDYRMPVWLRGAETAEIVSPFPQKLAVTALGYSGATGEAGIVAEIIPFASLAELEAAAPGSLNGKIAFLTHKMHATQDGSSYAAFGPLRTRGPAIAAGKGAAAVVVRSIGTDSHRLPHTGMTVVPPGARPIPAAALSVPDAENLERMIARGKPVTMRLVLTPRLLENQLSGNVVAEVPGSDPKAGIILVGGHLDSWDPGTGAVDDAAGMAITAAAAKRVLDAPGRPRRTIRLVWWGAEEVGGFGADAYFAAHKAENVVLVAESDFGADRIWRFDSGLAPANKALADAIAEALSPLGIARGLDQASGGPDVVKWRQSGVAAIDLQQDGTRYFDLHHTADDTLDKVDPEQLRQNVAAWTVMLTLTANSQETIARTAVR